MSLLLLGGPLENIESVSIGEFFILLMIKVSIVNFAH